MTLHSGRTHTRSCERRNQNLQSNRALPSKNLVGTGPCLRRPTARMLQCTRCHVDSMVELQAVSTWWMQMSPTRAAYCNAHPGGAIAPGAWLPKPAPVVNPAPATSHSPPRAETSHSPPPQVSEPSYNCNRLGVAISLVSPLCIRCSERERMADDHLSRVDC